MGTGARKLSVVDERVSLREGPEVTVEYVMGPP
jgi:hypothetical protein